MLTGNAVVVSIHPDVRAVLKKVPGLRAGAHL